MFALLLYADAAAAAAATPDEAMTELGRYDALSGELAGEGVLRGGEAFLPASTAVAIEVVDGEVVAERVVPNTRELSGFYLVACGEQRAHEIAARMPVATHGHVEVRPVLDLPDRR